ncbi:hypothetical protein OHA02_52460 [Streptomyces phaeochromogenes]|nr:hypothetical protein [Streptomyces phaeochromogenes]
MAEWHSKIGKLVEQSGMSVRQLKTRSGVSRTQCHCVIKGRDIYPWHTTEAIITALGDDPATWAPLWREARQALGRSADTGEPEAPQTAPAPLAPPAEEPNTRPGTNLEDAEELNASTKSIAPSPHPDTAPPAAAAGPPSKRSKRVRGVLVLVIAGVLVLGLGTLMVFMWPRDEEQGARKLTTRSSSTPTRAETSHPSSSSAPPPGHHPSQTAEDGGDRALTPAPDDPVAPPPADSPVPQSSASSACRQVRQYVVTDNGDVRGADENDIGDVIKGERFNVEPDQSGNPYEHRYYGTVDGRDLTGYVDQAKLDPAGSVCV